MSLLCPVNCSVFPCLWILFFSVTSQQKILNIKVQQKFQERSRPHKDALLHKALCRIQPQGALLHWVCKWIYMGHYWTWNPLFPFPQHRVLLLVAWKTNAIAPVERSRSDKMEHGISNTAWIESKAECKGGKLQPAVLHCGVGALTGESRGGFRLYFTRNSECNWLAGGYCWLYKYAFLSSSSSASFLKACLTILGLFVHVCG